MGKWETLALNIKTFDFDEALILDCFGNNCFGKLKRETSLKLGTLAVLLSKTSDIIIAFL